MDYAVVAGICTDCATEDNMGQGRDHNSWRDAGNGVAGDGVEPGTAPSMNWLRLMREKGDPARKASDFPTPQ